MDTDEVYSTELDKEYILSQNDLISHLHKLNVPSRSIMLLEVHWASPILFKISWKTARKRAQLCAIAFTIEKVEDIELSSKGPSIITFRLNAPPFFITSKSKNSGDVSEDVVETVKNADYFQVRCLEEMPLEHQRKLVDTVRAQKDPTPSLGKRKISCGKCDCCHNMKKQIKEINREKEELQQSIERKRQKMEEEEKAVENFERDVYNPLVYDAIRLREEHKAIKKILHRTPGLVEYRVTGMLDPLVLNRGGVSDEDASILYQLCVLHPSDPRAPGDERLASIRIRFGDEVADDVVRAWMDVQEVNPSGNYGTMLAWDIEEEREATVSTIVKRLVERLTKAFAENMWLTERMNALPPPPPPKPRSCAIM